MIDSKFFHGKRILVTGHAGFKGRWLTAWLSRWKAHVTGLSLDPEQFAPTDPTRFCTRYVAGAAHSTWGDVRDLECVRDAFKCARPEIVFHLAAQSLVRQSYRDPVDTFASNVQGTVNVLEAARHTPATRAVIVVTSDKCYAASAGQAHVESDPLGGRDPYSASKACAELVAQSYSHSYFLPSGRGLATVRAGNVFGGGDWSDERLVPDLVRALAAGKPLELRNPQATRPWQHVLAPLSGYLQLAQEVWAAPEDFSGAWNFGPRPEDHWTVQELARQLIARWGSGDIEFCGNVSADMPENPTLVLNSTKARTRLNWCTSWSLSEALTRTVQWYQLALSGSAEPDELMQQQIAAYLGEVQDDARPNVQDECAPVTMGARR